jgi:hypothetical protein
LNKYTNCIHCISRKKQRKQNKTCKMFTATAMNMKASLIASCNMHLCAWTKQEYIIFLVLFCPCTPGSTYTQVEESNNENDAGASYRDCFRGWCAVRRTHSWRPGTRKRPPRRPRSVGWNPSRNRSCRRREVTERRTENGTLERDGDCFVQWNCFMYVFHFLEF